MSTSLFEHYKAALRRGHVAALAGDLEEALAAYDEAGRLAPDRALPLASRGTVLHRLDRWPEAADAFDRALQLAPDDEAALRARATARAERELHPGAAADFERLAFVLDVAGRSKDAAEAARRAADLEPSPARAALADRLGAAAAAHAADLGSDHGPVTVEATGVRGEAQADGGGDPRPADLESAWAAMSERAGAEPETHVELGAYGALEALRAGLEAEARSAETPPDEIPAPGDDAPAHAAEPVAPEAADEGGNGLDAGGLEHATWPGIDLPSPPPPPVDATLDPEELLAEAALVLESGEVEAARDLMLTAVRLHREAGRTDAALDVCLNLLSIAPGDPGVHLAIANLQLDRGWKAVATEKLDLLVRLTSLTGDTQAEADVHGLAAERLRDDPAASTAGR